MPPKNVIMIINNLTLKQSSIVTKLLNTKSCNENVQAYKVLKIKLYKIQLQKLHDLHYAFKKHR